VNRGIDFDDPDVDTPDTVSKPGPQEQREVTVSVEGKYSEGSPDVDHPYHDYMNDNITGLAVLYSSATKITGATNDSYAWLMVVPRIVWTAGTANIDTGGTITYSAEGTAIAATDVNANTLAPDGQSGSTFFTSPANPEAYFVAAVANTDEPSVDTVFGPGVN